MWRWISSEKAANSVFVSFFESFLARFYYHRVQPSKTFIALTKCHQLNPLGGRQLETRTPYLGWEITEKIQDYILVGLFNSCLIWSGSRPGSSVLKSRTDEGASCVN